MSPKIVMNNSSTSSSFFFFASLLAIWICAFLGLASGGNVDVKNVSSSGIRAPRDNHISPFHTNMDTETALIRRVGIEATTITVTVKECTPTPTPARTVSSTFEPTAITPTPTPSNPCYSTRTQLPPLTTATGALYSLAGVNTEDNFGTTTLDVATDGCSSLEHSSSTSPRSSRYTMVTCNSSGCHTSTPTVGSTTTTTTTTAAATNTAAPKNQGGSLRRDGVGGVFALVAALVGVLVI